MSTFNSVFDDFPIEYKQINPEDFPGFNVADKIIIKPNADGFINDELQAAIDINEKNTVVINAAVGQGKTFSIIDIVKQYYHSSEDFLIFIASPYKSLVEQYYNKVISSGIPQEQVYRYEWIGKKKELDAWNSRIQIITVNTLLGNPGDDSLINNDEKRNYINYLVKQCETNNKKVVFIYDEVHDSIHNFKEKYIFNLWKWRNVIHKNFLLSATFNEASKIVIEYLSELTQDNIQIIESERIRIPLKQSDLFLHFEPSNSYKYNNDLIVSLVQSLIKEKKSVDILTFSKNLADDICKYTEEGIGNLLLNAFGEINNCTSNPYEDENNLENRYNPEKCNVGTNFKTGISIEKENHAFVIVLPPKGLKSKYYKNNYGIFSEGVNSITQALARQRIKGEIHLILPPPKSFDYSSLPFNDDEHKMETFKKFYDLCKDYKSNTEVCYFPLTSQNDLILEFYTKLTKDVQEEIQYVDSLNRNENRVRLKYIPFKLFKLYDGERYLSTYFPFFGKDLSGYITYSAFTNQFINCKLKQFNTKPPIYFIKGKIQWKFDEFYDSYMDIDLYNSWFVFLNDKFKYFELRNDLYRFYKILYKDLASSPYTTVEPYKNKHFEQQLVAFLQRILYPSNEHFRKKFKSGSFTKDAEYTRGEYFLSCISHATIMSKEPHLHSKEKTLVEAYLQLNNYREKMIDSIKSIEIKGEDMRYLDLDESFIDNEEEFTKMIEILSKEDTLISNNVFDFKNLFERKNYSIAQKKEAFIRYLKDDFLVGKNRRINNSKLDKNVFQVTYIHSIPKSTEVINFIQMADYKDHSFMDSFPYYTVIDEDLIMIEKT